MGVKGLYWCAICGFKEEAEFDEGWHSCPRCGNGMFRDRVVEEDLEDD